MARINAPLSSFGSELQATLRQGANKHIRIKFDTPALAVRFKQRVNALRHAMKKANHADWENLYRCGLYEDPADPCVVTIGPKDSEFRAALAAAGVTNLDEPPPVTEVSVSSPAPGDVDSFLSDLTAATDVQKVLGENTDAEPESEPDVSTL